MTPCGYAVCSGCPTCVRAWAAATGLRLAPWQRALVAAMFPPDPVLDQVAANRPDLPLTSAYPALLIRAGRMENA